MRPRRILRRFILVVCIACLSLPGLVGCLAASQNIRHLRAADEGLGGFHKLARHLSGPSGEMTMFFRLLSR